jgi:antitoxin HigA-1
MTLLTMSPFKAVCDREDMAPPHPGEILREDMLPHYKMTVAQLAQRLGITPASAADIIAERIAVDASLAARLGEVFALCPRYWQALQLQYDLWHNKNQPESRPNRLAETWGYRSKAAALPL